MRALAARALAAFVAALSICGGANAAEPWTFDVGGVARTATTFAPSVPASTPRPMIVALHGLNTTGEAARREQRFDPVAEREGFVVAYPDGIDKRWDYGRPLNSRPMPLVNGKTVDDIAFFRALIDRAVNELNVDRKRVYLTGSSNGGLMAHRVACAMDRELAAVASYITGMTSWQAQSCKRERAVPMLMLAGTADVYQTYAGTSGTPSGGYLLSVPNTVAIWQTRNGCKLFMEENLPDADKTDGTTVTSISYQDCSNGAEVLLYRINGGGHRLASPNEQPSTNPPYGRINRDIDTAEASWEFFKRFRLP